MLPYTLLLLSGMFLLHLYGQIYTSSKTHLYYPFSVKPKPQLYPTLEPFPRISRLGCIWLEIFQLSVSGVQRDNEDV